MTGVLKRWEVLTGGLAPGADWSYAGFCHRFNQMFPGLDFRAFETPTTAHEQWALSQTTHEHVLQVPESQRSPTQCITFPFNVLRDTRLMETIRAVSTDTDPLVVYGDVHLRALEETFDEVARTGPISW